MGNVINICAFISYNRNYNKQFNFLSHLFLVIYEYFQLFFHMQMLILV